MGDAGEKRGPEKQRAFSGRPPNPGKRPLEASGGKSGRTVYLLDAMPVRDLASALGLKPFRLIADLMQLKLFKTVDDTVDFETASLIARKHGYRPERPPPGMLVL